MSTKSNIDTDIMGLRNKTSEKIVAIFLFKNISISQYIDIFQAYLIRIDVKEILTHCFSLW